MTVRTILAGILLAALLSLNLSAQVSKNLFQPFSWEWPSANEQRLASGAPGPAYWQQQADYKISVTLDDEIRKLTGTETIVYHNNSPHTLTYLWLQLDQNVRAPGSAAQKIRSAPNYGDWGLLDERAPELPFQGGFVIKDVRGENGQTLNTQVVQTNMRLDLPAPLKPGETFTFSLDFSYLINDARLEGRSGYEYFAADRNCVYEIAQFYPRLCVYDDLNGWQNRPFLGPAEFALEFGDFEVAITVPEDHIVTATGTLQNPDEVLSATAKKRLEKIRATREEVAYVVTPDEARENQKRKAPGTRTWKFKADNVRDFAFASSRKFVWDAAVVEIGGKPVLAQSFYPLEGMPLWNTYSTHAVMHTLKVYSKYSVDYPWPQCSSIHGAIWGMEYPMVAFCGGRPSADGSYSYRGKYGMISVVIHEVGHNFFPMLVNNDERNWAWMDEGMNSFLQYLAELEFEPNFYHRRGPAERVIGYMSAGGQDAIMTNPESIRSNGSVSYAKTATGLDILRSIIMGPKVFDFALKEYARRWAGKHPQPADFFRSMEDASGMDLDWFWRGWFYTTDALDQGIESVSHYRAGRKGRVKNFPTGGMAVASRVRVKSGHYIEGKPQLKDQYTNLEPEGRNDLMDIFLPSLKSQIEALGSPEGGGPAPEKGLGKTGHHIYSIVLENQEGLAMPVILEVAYKDGTREEFHWPAEIWIRNNNRFRIEIRSPKPILAMMLDPFGELPDIDRKNNYWPREYNGKPIKLSTDD